MTIQAAIGKAIEGGWEYKGHAVAVVSDKGNGELYFIRTNYTHKVIVEEILLSPPSSKR